MNNHKNTLSPLRGEDSSQRTAVNCPCCMSFALLGVYLKKIQFNKRHTAILWEDKICHLANLLIYEKLLIVCINKAQ